MLQVLNKIQDFLLPVDTKNPTKDSPADWLDKILVEKNNKHFPEDETSNSDIRWKYVQNGMEYLKQLHKELVIASKQAAEGPLPPDAISIGHQSCVSGLVQMVLVFGAVPSFLPGVGLPIEKRTKFSQVLQNQPKLPIEELHYRLVEVVDNLLKLLDHDGLATIVFTRHLGDLMAALIQLSFAPLKKPNPETKSSGDFVMTEELYQTLSSEQQRFKEELYRIINRIYQPMVVKYLLVLQSTGAQEATKPLPKSINAKRLRTPKWLQTACGILLSNRLTKPQGLMHVIRGILDIGAETSEDLKKFQIIASIISNPPSTGKYSDLEEYFSLICPQILQILDLKDTSDAKTFHLIASACIRGMVDRSLVLSRRYLLNVLMAPLLKLSEDRLEGDVLVEEQELTACVERLHFVFVVSNDPSVMFVEHLRSVIMVLLDLHCKICFGVSHLKAPVEQLIERFMKGSSGALSMRALRSFAFNENSEADGFKVINTDVVFDGGEGGGMVARLNRYDEERQSFYVSDDEKSIAIVDLLEYSKFRTMTVEFFLHLLQDLTTMMDDQTQVPTGEPDHSNGSSMEDKANELIQMERDLEETMRKIRKRMMIIRLISLLSEDEKLQEAMMNNSAQKVEFLMSTIHRAVVMNKSREQKLDSTELQGLTTAVSLLRHHVTQKNVKIGDWKLLQKCLEDLKYLSDHYEDDTVAQVCGRLRELIATHGVVLEHNDTIRSAASTIQDKAKEMADKLEEIKLLSKEPATESYASALADANDIEIPVRGHGLIVLTRLVDQKDPETVDNIGHVIGLFKNNLQHKDTYVYLQSVKGLAMCCSFNPSLVISELTTQYQADFSAELEMEIRTKLGEALVQVTKILGELTPSHKNQLLNPVLAQLNHTDNLVRASALSNLGEICKNLKFSLNNVIFEIFDSLNNVISCDKSIEVRRAAVVVIVLLLEGLGNDAFKVLQSALRDIWRSLIKLRNCETDDVLLHHVVQAIGLIDKIVKQFFQPDPSLKKTIYVLDEPPC